MNKAGAYSLKPATRVGFSLIEVLVVVALVGLAAAAVSIRWSSIYQDAKLQSNVEKVIDIDMKARRHAVSRNLVCRLEYDEDEQTIRSTRWVDGIEKLKTSLIASPTKLVELRILDSGDQRDKAILRISGSGATITYAVHLQQKEKHRWIVFAGRTGDAKVYDDEAEFEEASRVLESRRFNAH